MKNYFVIHGSFGSQYSNWFSWLFSEIEKTKEQSSRFHIYLMAMLSTAPYSALWVLAESIKLLIGSRMAQACTSSVLLDRQEGILCQICQRLLQTFPIRPHSHTSPSRPRPLCHKDRHSITIHQNAPPLNTIYTFKNKTYRLIT